MDDIVSALIRVDMAPLFYKLIDRLAFALSISKMLGHIQFLKEIAAPSSARMAAISAAVARGSGADVTLPS